MAEIAFEYVQEILSNCEVSEYETDNDGQLVYYSGIYKWTDKSGNPSYHDEAETKSDPRLSPTFGTSCNGQACGFCGDCLDKS